MKKNILVKSGGRMVPRNVEMTQEEIAELTRKKAQLPGQEPTLEERLNTLETTTDDIVLMLADIIGGE